MMIPEFKKHVWEDLLFHDEFCDGVCVSTGQGEQTCTPHSTTADQEAFSGGTESQTSGYAPMPVDDDETRDGFEECDSYTPDYFRK